MSENEPPRRAPPPPKKQIRALKSSGTVRVDSSPVEPTPPLGNEIQALQATSTRVEQATVDLPAPTGGGAEIQALQATSTRVEPSAPEDATPLVILPDEPPASDVDVSEASELTASALIGEVKGLRTRNSILRTERTAMAGRKYALEVVIESLKDKLEVLAKLCEAVDAPGELGEALGRLREAIGSARRIALGRDPVQDELESERTKRLEEMRALEQKVSDLEETVAGLRAERDSLRERTGWLERERIGLQERVVDVEEELAREREAHGTSKHEADELATIRQEANDLRARFAAHEQERSEYLEKIAHLEALAPEHEALKNRLDVLERARQVLADEADELRGQAATAARAMTETVAERERVESATAHERERAAAAEARLGEVEARAAELVGRTTEAEARAAEAEARLAAAEARAAAAEERSAEVTDGAPEREARLAEAEARVAALQEEKSTWEARADSRFAAGQARAEQLEGRLNEILQEKATWENRAQAGKTATIEARSELERTTKRLDQADGKRKLLEERVTALEKEIGEKKKRLEEQRALINEARPVLERLDKDNQRLGRLLGDARARGRVNVEELMARATLLRRLEQMSAAADR